MCKSRCFVFWIKSWRNQSLLECSLVFPSWPRFLLLSGQSLLVKIYMKKNWGIGGEDGNNNYTLSREENENHSRTSSSSRQLWRQSVWRSMNTDQTTTWLLPDLTWRWDRLLEMTSESSQHNFSSLSLLAFFQQESSLSFLTRKQKDFKNYYA